MKLLKGRRFLTCTWARRMLHIAGITCALPYPAVSLDGCCCQLFCPLLPLLNPAAESPSRLALAAEIGTNMHREGKIPSFVAYP